MKNTKFEKVANNFSNEQDIVWDIEYAMRDLYLAEFVGTGSELKILFDNGQKFAVSVRECK